MANQVVTRIAPSPTGNLHVGTARSALFNYLYARKCGGKFIVRVEDTDKARSTKAFEKDILDGLDWLGLEHDELHRQSENTNCYVEVIEELISKDVAYLSKEPSKDDPNVEVEVVRLRNPGKEITFTDEVRGAITFDTTELGDFVIARSKTDPLYHLTVVVDDHDMGITHVIRGEDHISNTPRQILIQEALGFHRPHYVHMPLILALDRSKLSKRKGETSVSKYAEEFLPESLVNYLALLGWNPGTEQEIFTMAELIEHFSLDKIQKGGAIFDVEKLKSINKEHLGKLTDGVFIEHIQNVLPDASATLAEKLVPVIRERVRTFGEIKEMAEAGEFVYYSKAPEIDIEKLCWKDDPKDITKKHLDKAVEILESVTNWDIASIKSSVWPYAEEVGRGNVLWPLRFALTGVDKSPDPFTVANILGKEETIARLKSAFETL